MSNEQAQPELEIFAPSSDVAVVVLYGEHDLTSKDSLRDTFESLIETKRVVVADLSSVLYIDSATLAELIRADRTADRAGKQFRLQLGTEPIVRRVLEISGLLKVLDVYPTREEAIEGRSIKPPDRLL